ncbi:hypothetical protein [Planobispora longispora]|uniref:Uncharacterized protein n=1 Tax=Planobispora longispora TaxID=28887 RepID=A0A8J3RHR9_9ACTN|nr:hypothetical protein [Planobispora longispora]GIH75060.1 hypothetical protein Plo01_14890 [Planobispora longispora]
MRKTLTTAALAGAMALTALTLGPAAAQAAAQPAAQPAASAATTVVKWGKFFSGDRKAYTFGKTWKAHGKVYTKWYGVDRVGGKKGWVWFEVYRNGGWHKFNKSWDGKTVGTWSGHGIEKVYTYTCWAGKFENCGKKYRIY